MKERRKYSRLEEVLPLTFERKGPTGILRGKGTTKNVSPGGLCLAIDKPLGVGEKIHLTLALPDPSPLVSLEGRVTWMKGGASSSSEVGIALSETLDSHHCRYLLFVCEVLCKALERQKDL